MQATTWRPCLASISLSHLFWLQKQAKANGPQGVLVVLCSVTVCLMRVSICIKSVLAQVSTCFKAHLQLMLTDVLTYLRALS